MKFKSLVQYNALRYVPAETTAAKRSQVSQLGRAVRAVCNERTELLNRLTVLDRTLQRLATEYLKAERDVNV